MKRCKAYVKDGEAVLRGAPAPDSRAAGGSSKTFARQFFGVLVEGFGSLAVLIEVVCGKDRLNVAFGTFVDRADSGLCFRRGEQCFEGCGECVAVGCMFDAETVFWGYVCAVHSVPSFSSEGEPRCVASVSLADDLSIGVAGPL